jgi:hypothetical protein
MNWRDSARELDRSRLALESTWKIFIWLSSNCDQIYRSCENREFAGSAQQRGREREWTRVRFEGSQESGARLTQQGIARLLRSGADR